MTWLSRIRKSIENSRSWHAVGILVWLGVVSLVAFYAWLTSWYWHKVFDQNPDLKPSTNPAVFTADKLGQYGDFVGGLMNPLLALVSLVGFLFTLAMAFAQLNESRKATDMAREQSERASRLTALDSMLRSAEERILFYNNLKWTDSFTYKKEVDWWTSRRDELREEIEVIYVALHKRVAPDVPLRPTIQETDNARQKKWALD